MNTTTKSNSKEFIEIPSNSTMAKDITSYKKNKFTTRDLAETSLLIALVFIATRFINIRLPLASTGGLVHLGNTMLFIAAIVFGKRKGAIAGAFGMGLFDLLSEWAIWAPFTFVIVGLMGFVVGKLTEDEKHQNFKWYVIAIAAACVIKVVGYYIAEIVIYGNFFSPVASIPGNLVQIGVAAVIVLIVIAPLNVAAKKTGLKR